MFKRAHLGLLLAAVAIGIIVIVWPVPVSDEPDAPGSGDASPDPEFVTGDLPDDDTDNRPQSAMTDASLWNAQALNAWHAGDISGAMTLFEQAIDRFPDDPEPFSNYGRLLTLMVDYETALPLLERARDLRPDDAQSWLDLATLYERAQVLDRSWAAQAQAEKLVGSEAITRDTEGRFVVEGNTLW